jgi:hypothetical protein
LRVNFLDFNSYEKTFKMLKVTQKHQKYIFLDFFVVFFLYFLDFFFFKKRIKNRIITTANNRQEDKAGCIA